jgi:hypothetical protein
VRSTVGSINIVPPAVPPLWATESVYVTSEGVDSLALGNDITTSDLANFLVSWGDDTTTEYASGAFVSHTYGSTGTYEIRFQHRIGSSFAHVNLNGQTSLTAATFDIGAFDVAGIHQFRLDACALTQAAVDQLIQDAMADNWSNSDAVLMLTSAGNAVPSVARFDDINTLNGLGVLLYINAYFLTAPAIAVPGTGYATADYSRTLGGTVLNGAPFHNIRIDSQTAGVPDTIEAWVAPANLVDDPGPYTTDAVVGTGTGLTVTYTTVVSIWSPND